MLSPLRPTPRALGPGIPGSVHLRITAGPLQPGLSLACPSFGDILWSGQGVPQEITFAQCPFCLPPWVLRDLSAGFFLAERSRGGLGQEFAVQFPAAAGPERQGGHAGLVRDPAG